MHPYTIELEKIKPGRPFMMVNYDGVYIRIVTDENYGIVRDSAISRKEYPFNDDGVHVPIVDLHTGNLFYMAKSKPCFLYPGESHL